MENTQFGARLNSFKLGLGQPEIEAAGNLTLALLKRATQGSNLRRFEFSRSLF